jgi:hypothetical protein
MSIEVLWSDNLDSFACAKGVSAMHDLAVHKVSLKENRKIEKRFSGFLVDVEYCYDQLMNLAYTSSIRVINKKIIVLLSHDPM